MVGMTRALRDTNCGHDLTKRESDLRVLAVDSITDNRNSEVQLSSLHHKNKQNTLAPV